MFCNKCGKEISNDSKCCRFCGTPIFQTNNTTINVAGSHSKNKTKKQVYQKTWFWILIVFLILIIIGMMSGNDNQNTVSTGSLNTEKKEEVKEKVIEVDYEKLYQEYQDNAIAADGKYKGKVLQLKGKVDNINREIAGNPFVTFSVGGEYSFKDVRLTLKKSEEEKVSKLTKGQTITVKGKCSGQLVTGTVSLYDCEIIK